MSEFPIPSMAACCIRELAPAPAAEEAFVRLCRLPHCLFLDSAMRLPELGRYSFLAADPFEFWRIAADGTDGLARLEQQLGLYRSETIPGLPPFQGGAAGLLSYELAHAYERLPRARYDEFEVPALAVGWYDVVLAYDHLQGRAWVISQGWPETDPARRRRRAERRLGEFLEWLRRPAGESPRAVRGRRPARSSLTGSITGSEAYPAGLAPADLAERFPAGGLNGLTSNFSADGYREAVARAVEYIHAGDVFQVNLSQRLLYPAASDPVSLYQRLRTRNPAPFAAYFDLGPFQVVSASPERFVRVADGRVEARPIKGTRARTARPEADLFAGDDLRASEKDRAENVMIVDLLRNDLSRACRPDSVRVTALCRLEVYAYVQHLVSVVEGTLRDGSSALELVRGAFPGGSITGAPKVRAMEIIAELEPTARGAYCGCLGYVGFDGSLDLSILIRTITAGRGWWQMPVGGGIVAPSHPQRELEETWHKAAGMIRALV